MKARVAAALVAVALASGYVAGRDPPPLESGPGPALRAYHRARIDALGECAKYGYATVEGELVPDSRIAGECMALRPPECAARYEAPRVVEPPQYGPRL